MTEQVAMKTVKEVSTLTGISIRTLHHYDAIGLLKPAAITEAGYRLYDTAALRRLQSILLFRELQFPLKEIKAILDSPDFCPEEALEQQITLLELQKKHLEELISFAREIQKKGVTNMNFDAFQTAELDQYAEEVKERWGSTGAYKEYQKKTEGKTDKELQDSANALLSLFADFGALRRLSPETPAPERPEVQEKIKELQEFLTEHYYTCTDEILQGLSQMYVADERMKRNIDNAGGEGTAEFVREAVSVYLQGN